MSRILLWILAGLLGLAIGAGSALAMAGLLPGVADEPGGTVDVAGWRSDFAIGSVAADPYTRARIARHGLLALARSEAVYFTRARDEAGRPLSERCTYRLSGGAMPARWWSVTLYDGSGRLPMNDDAALSIDATRVGPGPWRATIAPTRPATGPWISSRKAGRFDLTLRLYVPDPALFAAPGRTLDPPTIRRLSCAGGR